MQAAVVFYAAPHLALKAHPSWTWSRYDTAWLLLEQAMLIEGLTLDDPGRFVQRLNRVLSRAV